MPDSTSARPTISAGKARRLRRLQTPDGHFSMVALDQRAILARMLAERVGVAEHDLPFTDMLAVKRTLVETLAAEASAMLFDPNIAIPAALNQLPGDTGLIVSLEHHIVDDTARGRKTASIPNWSVQKIQQLGADGVKLLVWYHPDADADVCAHQQHYIRSVGRACSEFEIPLILELLAYWPEGTEKADDAAAERDALADVVYRSVQEFARPEYAVDIFKLESPVPVAQLTPLAESGPEPAFEAIGQLCRSHDIPWVLLSAGVTASEFLNVVEHAYSAGAHGFLAGRAIWKQALGHFPDLAACRAELLASGVPSLQRLNRTTRDHAHACAVPAVDFAAIRADGDFASQYPTGAQA